MSEKTNTSNSTDLYLNDLSCQYCLYTKRKTKKYKNGCREDKCRFEDIRKEAAKSGRIKRKKGVIHDVIQSLLSEGGKES